MTALRSIYAVARADFFERIRRYSFFLTVLFAVILGIGAATGKISIRLGEYRGVYTSAWIGTMVAMVTTCFVSLVGFYVVKNSIDRDRQTRVGQILAATPLAKPSYTLGKFLSNFGVLSSMVFVLAIAALIMQFFFAEDSHRDFVALLLPFFLLALPTMAMTAALAVLFETLPILRGGVGNIAWFFLFTFGISLPALTGNRWLDTSGLITVGNSMMAAARGVIPGYKDSFSLSIDTEHVEVFRALRWQGISWTGGDVLQRVACLTLAVLVALLAALFFDRFDAAARLTIHRKKSKPSSTNETSKDSAISPASVHTAHLTPLSPSAHSNAFGRLFSAELRLALQGFRWWWYAIAAALLVAQIFSPLDVTRGPLLGTAWIWPVLVWSAMGARESRFSTQGLLFSSPRILLRQLPACFLAGFAVAVLTGLAAGVRLLLAGQKLGFFAWLAGALFLPALALGSGVVSGTGKVFEALLTMLWYIGPMNHVSGFDFTGSANGPQTLHYIAVYAVMSVALLAFAFFVRARQLRSN